MGVVLEYCLMIEDKSRFKFIFLLRKPIPEARIAIPDANKTLSKPFCR